MATTLMILVVAWVGVRSHKVVSHLLSSSVVGSLLVVLAASVGSLVGVDFRGAGLVDSSSTSILMVVVGGEDIDIRMGIVVVL